ncbi:MAG TPA: hypothetical protein VNV15_06315 [Opitutaceae bacterium]|jgi:hypothetical protein|nr:hypothetical protein [Opitutaceae bacterium]
MALNGTPRNLNVEASVPYKGKWRLAKVKGSQASGKEPEIHSVVLLAFNKDLTAELDDAQRVAIIKELKAAAKRDERGSFGRGTK